ARPEAPAHDGPAEPKIRESIPVPALQPHPDAALPRAVPQRRERAAGGAHGVGKDRRRRDRHHADAQPARGGEGM
ncbi:unnamed protein product, partial [Ectocarpus fasciculatus]